MSMERMVDVIKEGVIVTIPESHARAEDLFILRVHEDKPLVESLPSIESRRRSSQTKSLAPVKSVGKWHSYEPEYKKNNVARELVENFHWEIAKARKARSLTRLQLANALNVPEVAIKLVETGELPSDDFVLINKIQSYLGINIRKDGNNFVAPVVNARIPAPAGSAYISKPDFSRSDLSLSELQRFKESRERPRVAHRNDESDKKSSLSGSDIEIIE